MTTTYVASVSNKFKPSTYKFTTFIVCSVDRLDDIATELEANISNRVNAKAKFIASWEGKTPCGIDGFYLGFKWLGKGLCATTSFISEEHISNFAEYDSQCDAYFKFKWNPFAGSPGQFYATKKGVEDISTCGNWERSRHKRINLQLDLDRGFAPAIEIPDGWHKNTLEISEHASYFISCHGSPIYARIKASPEWICGDGTTGKIEIQTDICDRRIKSGYQAVDRVTVIKSSNCLL